MDPATRAHVKGLVADHQTNAGRSLSELMKTQEILKGAESQRLRTFFTSNCMEPGRDLDAYGVFLANGDLAQVKDDFASRVARHAATASDSETPAPGPSTRTNEPAAQLTPEAAAAQELYALTWGPTVVRIYGLLGLLRIIYPGRAAQHLAVARFLIDTAKVPVDGPDLSGTLALSHAISTKPALDFEYAQLLYDAGGDVNNRNRYGGTAAHEIAQIWTPQDKSVVARATSAFKWFLDHGGNVDIADSDGMTVRYMTSRTESLVPGLSALVAASDRDRTRGECCALCGRTADETMKRCARCKVARYCAPDVRACQKIDWPHHKKGCVKVAEVAKEGFSFLGTKF
ncbi:MYND-type domain-containing protein [Mycena venus]|uniref:MYND-type domain-containing protein n=1 Tax=Mycena venus TaxID=2733690 RepID=A0A8H7D610_9AGAR|nr:MYND-type domain-containing protein [Mycena venus]